VPRRFAAYFAHLQHYPAPYHHKNLWRFCPFFASKRALPLPQIYQHMQKNKPFTNDRSTWNMAPPRNDKKISHKIL